MDQAEVLAMHPIVTGIWTTFGIIFLFPETKVLYNENLRGVPLNSQVPVTLLPLPGRGTAANYHTSSILPPDR